ncbi:hypothetical protein [Streptomyces sp. NBC_00019]
MADEMLGSSRTETITPLTAAGKSSLGTSVDALLGGLLGGR